MVSYKNVQYATCDALDVAKCKKAEGKENVEYKGLHANLGDVSRLDGSQQIASAAR